MQRKCKIILLAFWMQGLVTYAQVNPSDTTISPKDDILLIDTTLDYDLLFQDLDAFFDSLLTPRSYFLASISLGNSYYNFEGKSSTSIETARKLLYSPLLGYYHKTGLGISAAGYITEDGENINPYQFSISPSYDYIQNRSFVTGISFTKYFTKDSLPFYTTPIQNEVYGYFTYRKTWLRPTVSINYGWGSRTEFRKRRTLIEDLRLRRNGFTYINTKESISDFSLQVAVRHDFYWLNIFATKDHIRFTPQLSFINGTQKFGFNRSSGTYVTVLRTGNNVLFNSDNYALDNELKFQPLSLTLSLRGEYSIGKFFIQPQLIFDYYFPADTKNFNSLFSLNIGFLF